MIQFLSKLAWNNLKSNHRLYLPFALVMTTIIAMSYSFVSLTQNQTIAEGRGGTAMLTVLNLGIFVVILIAVCILFYGNNFVLKNRMREFGLYSILGVDKVQLSWLVAIELFLIGTITIVLGLGVGIIFDQLVFAMLQYLMHAPVQLVSTFSMKAVVVTGFSFVVGYFVVFLMNIFKMMRLRPLEILKETRTGAKKARFILIKALIGFALLIVSYYIANNISDPVNAINLFLLLVVVVIVGTFLVFEAGTVWVLQLLKKNPAFYYHPTSMVSVSNLIYRMKQNAMGLATICILCTMTLVTVVGASSLYLGSNRMINIQQPSDVTIQTIGDYDDQAAIDVRLATETEKFLTDNGIKLTDQSNFKVLEIFGHLGQGTLQTHSIDAISDGQLNAITINVMDVELMKRITGKDYVLADDEVLLFAKTPETSSELKINDQPFKIKEQSSDVSFLAGKLPLDFGYITDRYALLVVPKFETVTGALSQGEFKYKSGAMMDIDLTTEQQVSLIPAREYIDENEIIEIMGRASFASDYNALIGVALFIAIFLSVLFTIGIILTMYYKQISEGFEDKKRFVTLHQIGLDSKMVKKTIRQQVLLVFFLPIIVAVIHLAFAYKLITQIIMLIAGVVPLQVLTIAIGTTLIFILAYVFIYSLTARSYTRFVNPQRTQ